MCNAMFALKGGNSIIIGPHPRSKKCSSETVRLINETITALGAPDGLIQIIEEPTIELSGELMRMADVVVATGGMPMVKSAYSSGKPAYGVGVGNVQCIFDRGIDYTAAAKKVIEGREFDNGIICSGEQTAILPADEYDAIIKAFIAGGCFYIGDEVTAAKITGTLFPDGVMNKNLVGVSAIKVAETAGIKVPPDTRVIMVKAPSCGSSSYLSKEKMCPVISVYSYDTFPDAVATAQANLNVDGRGHSVSIHSDNRVNIEYAAETLTVSRVLINQICSTMNGGSFQNSLTPTTTLGCASWGNNSISENFSHRHLLNIIRIAYLKPDAVIPADEEIWS
jgi:succinate-semialdehyde dehydrogenase